MLFRETTLFNGLRVVAEINPDGYSASFGYFVHTGARDESDAIAGVSHFLEHMVFKGTATRSAADVNRQLDELGGYSNAYTSEEQTVYYAAVIPKYQDRIVELLTDLMRPTLRTEDFDSERQVILEEIAKYDDQPPFGAFERSMEVYFGHHGLGRRILGTAETVSAISAEAMRDYFSERYTPGEMVVAAAGNLDFDALVAALQRQTAAWPARPRLAQRVPPALPTPEPTALAAGSASPAPTAPAAGLSNSAPTAPAAGPSPPEPTALAAGSASPAPTAPAAGPSPPEPTALAAGSASPAPTAPAAGFPKRETIPALDAMQSYAVALSGAPSLRDDDRYTMRLLATLLGDESGSRLFWELTDTGRAEVATVWPQEFEDCGVLMSYLVCHPDDMASNQRLVEEVFERLSTGGVEEQELRQAINKTTAGLVLQSEQPSSRMFTIGNAWQVRGTYEPLDEVLDRYRRITPQHIADLVKRYPLSPTTQILAQP